MTTRSPIFIGLAAATLTACALGLSGTQAPGMAHGVQGPTVQGRPGALPFACSLHAKAQGGGTMLEGRLQAHKPIAATFALRIRGPGVSIDQGGDLSLLAEESTVIGVASISGLPESLDATLTVSLDGQSYACPLVVE